MCFLDGMAVENGGLHAVDEHAPECQLADDFVHGSLGDKEFFKGVAEAVEGLSEQAEKISLESVCWGLQMDIVSISVMQKWLVY